MISQLTNDTAVARSGIALGDVVLSVDGETVDARMKRFSAFLPASSPQAQRNAVATRLLRGPLGAPATLEIQDAEGRIKTVSLPRERGAAAGLRWFRSGPAYRLLADNVGYIDLEKLTIAMVDSAFDALAGARAIVFDARGYPQGTGMAIARRLARVPGTPAARLSRIVRRGPDTATAETYSFVQVVPDPVAERYQGPTAVIVDERTFSQGEHVALLLKAANGTLIVGSPTNGTDGDVATLFVARGTTTAITGHEVMYPDGTPIQGIGLRLDVVVNATIAGVRAGRDELLARAVREVLRVK